MDPKILNDRRYDFWMKRRWNEIDALNEFDALMDVKFIDEEYIIEEIEKKKQALIK